MARYALQRLLLGFLLMQVVPTDPATVRAGPTATPDVIAAIRADLGLDRPLWEQFGRYVWRLAQGDLGLSIINNVAVMQELGATVGPTLELMLASLFCSIPLGILLGTAAAYWRGTVFDRAVMAFAAACATVPELFLALLLIWFVGFKWQLLPSTGRGGPLWTLDGLKAIAAGVGPRWHPHRPGGAHDAHRRARRAGRRPRADGAR